MYTGWLSSLKQDQIFEQSRLCRLSGPSSVFYKRQRRKEASSVLCTIIAIQTRRCFPFGEQILSKEPPSDLRITIKNIRLITCLLQHGSSSSVLYVCALPSPLGSPQAGGCISLLSVFQCLTQSGCCVSIGVPLNSKGKGPAPMLSSYY